MLAPICFAYDINSKLIFTNCVFDIQNLIYLIFKVFFVVVLVVSLKFVIPGQSQFNLHVILI